MLVNRGKIKKRGQQILRKNFGFNGLFKINSKYFPETLPGLESRENLSGVHREIFNHDTGNFFRLPGNLTIFEFWKTVQL
jgi:hypothetical protein